MRKLWLLAALGACAGKNTSTPLADLEAKFGAPTIEVDANVGQINILLHVADTASCPEIGGDVVATFDGQQMDVARGGYDTDSSGCFPVGFWFNSVPTTAVLGFESLNKTSELEVVDPSATWNISTVRLLSNDFEIDAANSRVVWEDVSAISTAEVFPGGAKAIVGNEIDYPPGTQVQYVDAYAHPVATVCSGPTQCLVDLQGAKTWTGGTSP